MGDITFVEHMANPATWTQALAESQLLFDDIMHTIVRDGVAPRVVPVDRSYTPVQIILIYSLALFVFNWACRFFVVGPVAQLLLRRSDKPAKSAVVTKFSQSAMEGFFYGGGSVVGCLVVLHQGFVWPSIQWWTDARYTPIGGDMACFYLAYCARYCQCFISMMFEFRRKDFWEMQIHHVVTIVLILLSYYHEFIPVGAMIMLLFDPADVPLHVAKLFKYIADSAPKDGWKYSFNQFVSNRLFEVFAVSFFITRIVMYPYTIWSAVAEGDNVGAGLGTKGWWCVWCLVIIQFLQWYWMALIIRVAVKTAQTGAVEDARSDDESDEDEKPKKA